MELGSSWLSAAPAKIGGGGPRPARVQRGLTPPPSPSHSPPVREKTAPRRVPACGRSTCASCPGSVGSPPTTRSTSRRLARARGQPRRPGRLAPGHRARSAASPRARRRRRVAEAAAHPARGAAGRVRRPRHPGRPARRRHRHRPAGRAVRRSALYAAEGADRHATGAARRGRPRRAGRAGVLDRRRGPRLGGSGVDDGARRRVAAARHHGCAPRRAPGTCRSPGSRSTARCSRAGPAAGRAAPDRVHRRRVDRLAGRMPGRGMAEAFGRWMEAVLGPLGLVVYDSPTRPPSRSRHRCSRAITPGETPALAAAAGAALVGGGYHAQVARAPRRRRAVSSRRGAPRHPARTAGASRRRPRGRLPRR